MKKTYIYILLFIVVFIAAVFAGYKLYTGGESKSSISTNKEIENTIKQDSIKEVSAKEEKVSPNANFILKKYYSTCGHITNEFVELPAELVNMTKQQIENNYKDWKVEKFSSGEVILYKEEQGYCNEHYILRNNDNLLSIYRLDESGNEELYENTHITLEYLPQEDLLRINEGIKAYGKEALNSAIEDFE